MKIKLMGVFLILGIVIATSMLQKIRQTKTIEEPTVLYQYKKKNGEVVFSNIKKTPEYQTYHLTNDNISFIKMHSTDIHTNKKDKSTIHSVLDPVNSINQEAVKNVEKMRTVKQEQMAF